MPLIDSIKSHQTFIKAKHSGIFRTTDFFTLQTLKIETSKPGPCFCYSEGTSYIGLTVSKRLGNAVKRNRVKRRLCIASKQILNLRGIDGFAYIFIAKLAIIQASWGDLIEQIETAVSFVNNKIKNQYLANK